jgi:hypothetical protein
MPSLSSRNKLVKILVLASFFKMSTNRDTSFKCALCKTRMEYKEYSSTCLHCETLWCLECDSKIGTDPCPSCQTSPFIVGIHHRLDRETAIGVEFPDSRFPIYIPLDEFHELPFVHAFSWETKRRVYPKPAFYWILKEWGKVQTCIGPCTYCHQFCPTMHFSNCLTCGKAWCTDCDVQLRSRGCPFCTSSVHATSLSRNFTATHLPPPRVHPKTKPSVLPPSYESVFESDREILRRGLLKK